MLRARGALLLAAGVLGLVAALLPPLPRTGTAVEFIAVFDITQSMNVADQSVNGENASRLRYAQQALIAAMRKLPCGSKVGIGVFAKRRTLMLLSPVEICANRFELTQAIEQTDSRMAWEQGSQVARGLFSALEAVAEMPTAPTLLFFTDGHEAPPLDAEDLARFERPAVRVQGLLAGVGGTTPQPIPRTDREGRAIGWWSADVVTQRAVPGSSEHLSALQLPHLLELARMTGLDYVQVDTPPQLYKAMTAPAYARQQTVATDLRWLPAVLAGVLLAMFYLPLPAWRTQSSRAAFNWSWWKRRWSSMKVEMK